MKRIELSILATMLAAILLPTLQSAATIGVSPQTQTPTAEQIVDRYVQALGGAAAIQKITSRTSKGTVEIVGVGATGTIEYYEKAPNKQMHLLTVPDVFTSYGGFNGSMGWSFDQEKNKPTELKGKDLESLKADSEFYKSIRIKDQSSRITFKGEEKIQFRDGPRQTYVVEAKPETGNSRKMYFDTETGLLIRQDTQDSTSEGKVPVREFYLDYKNVDGVMVPFTIRHAEEGVTMILRFSEVKQNAPIDDSKFDPPATKAKS
jgi:outer membrane lipoprotein-sorting protein